VCSGAILNNTANDKTPYAFTANHCWNAYQNTGIWVFRFNWESPTCTPTTNSSYNTMSGSVVRMRTASNTSATDACLVELNQPIPEEYGVFYAGWSRSTTAPTSGMIIHHPALDIKKITPSTNIYAVTQYVQGWRANVPGGGACTEGGSSGSPLFDQNGRVIGSEYGGQSFCGASAVQMFDVWGRFDISWNGSSSANRLKDWLDPLNLDPEIWDGTYGEIPEPIVDAELLDIIVPEEFYNYAATIEPKVTIKNSGNLPITSATISYTIDEGDPVTKPWAGTLNTGATVDILFDAITLTSEMHVFKATVTVEDDANPDNNSKTKIFEVIIEPELCEKPENLAVVLDGNIPVVNWDEPQEIDGILSMYRIYRNEEPITSVLPYITEFRDEALPMGTYTYQVEAIYEHCESGLTEGVILIIVGINEIPTNAFQLFPNPATNEVTIIGIGLTQVEIYDVAGRKLSSNHLSSSSSHQTINVSHLTSGVYLVKMFTENNQTVTKRLIIAK
jgi:hypothetical protein